jgi:hypothetical protein
MGRLLFVALAVLGAGATAKNFRRGGGPKKLLATDQTNVQVNSLSAAIRQAMNDPVKKLALQSEDYKRMIDWYCVGDHAQQAVCRRAKLTAEAHSLPDGEARAKVAAEIRAIVTREGDPTLQMAHKAYCKDAGASTDPCKRMARAVQFNEMVAWFCQKAEQKDTTYCKRNALNTQLRALPNTAIAERKAALAQLTALGSAASAAAAEVMKAFESSKREFCALPGKAELLACEGHAPQTAEKKSSFFG